MSRENQQMVTPEECYDALLLTEFSCDNQLLQLVHSWTDEQRAQATAWALTEHVAASDNDVQRLPRPNFLPPGSMIWWDGTVDWEAWRNVANRTRAEVVRIRPTEKKFKMPWWRWSWLYWLAKFRLSQYAVCTMSDDLGADDFHDYPDSIEGEPFHMTLLTCRHCGKQFTI